MAVTQRIEGELVEYRVITNEKSLEEQMNWAATEDWRYKDTLYAVRTGDGIALSVAVLMERTVEATGSD